MIWIDNKLYEVGIQSVVRGEDIDYKYDLITESGHRRQEVRARYRTYTVLLGNLIQYQYDALVRVLSNNNLVHTVTLPDGQKNVTLEATITKSTDTLLMIEKGSNEKRWTNLTLTIKGVNPMEDTA